MEKIKYISLEKEQFKQKNKFMKTELEEAAEKKYPTIHEQYQYDAFIEGAKWKEEQVSHEDINLKKAIALLKLTTEYEVVESFREKVNSLEPK
jgi:hypothetical protein